MDFVDVEDGVPLAILRQRKDRLRSLYDLTGFQIACGDDAVRFGPQRGVAENVLSTSPATLAPTSSAPSAVRNPSCAWS